MIRRAVDFIEKARQIATNYKTLYVMGCFGAPMTSLNKTRYMNNCSYNRGSARSAKINNASSDTFGFDCVCLIKGILWGWYGDLNKSYGGASYASNDVPDVDADQMMKYCSGVSTDFTSIVPGEVVHLQGHIGIYIGSGLVVECTPAWKDGVQITACANLGKVQGYNSRKWADHGKLNWIDYSATKYLELANGLNTVTVDNATYKIIKGYGEYKQVHMMSSPGVMPAQSLQQIWKFDSSEMLVLGMINCNYFEMNSTNYGLHYGVEQSEGDGVHSVGLDLTPKQPGIQVFYQTVNGEYGYCTADKYYYSRKEVIFACTPYAITIHKGQVINARSTNYANKDLLKSKCSAACVTADGSWHLIISLNDVLPGEMTSLMRKIGAVEGFILDGGGSTQMIYIGEKIVSTGRPLPNVLALACYKPKEKPKDDPEVKNDALTKEVASLKAKIVTLEEKIRKAKEALE